MIAPQSHPSSAGGQRLRIACSGYVETHTGSIAGAGNLLVQELLRRGHDVCFFSKKSFVHPVALLEQYKNMSFVDVTNTTTDTVHRRIGPWVGPVGRTITAMLNSLRYRRLISRQIQISHDERPFDVGFFIGTPAVRVSSHLPMVSWVQGAPGSDARSLRDRKDLLQQVEPWWRRQMLSTYAWYRLNVGLPDYGPSSVCITGSSMTAEILRAQFAVGQDVRSLPYPIDLELFNIRNRADMNSASIDSTLKVLWLGRVVPRKRLDLFLDGCRQAVDNGVDLQITLIGSIGFAPGLKRLIERFPYPERLQHSNFIDRVNIPELMSAVDVLAQPSDEEDFGSSVAEAMACGVPCIVGATNGTGEYLDSTSVRLNDDRIGTMAAALQHFKAMKESGELEAQKTCIRRKAETTFSVESVVDRLESVLYETAANCRRRDSDLLAHGNRWET